MAKVLEYNAKVASVEMLGSHLAVIKVKPDMPIKAFLSGQYATLGLKQKSARAQHALDEKEPNSDPEYMIRRAYSVASAPDGEELEFYLAMVDDGTLTPRLFALKVGDPLYIGPKIIGRFTLDPVPETHHLLLLSTGTGLAPYMSMIRDQNFKWNGERKVIVLHGVRHEADLGYRQELEVLDKDQKQFDYIPVLSSGGESWEGATGYVQDVLLDGFVKELTGLDISSENAAAFLCGNPLMIEGAIKRLEAMDFVLAKGRTPGNIHIEEYW